MTEESVMGNAEATEETYSAETTYSTEAAYSTESYNRLIMKIKGISSSG